MEDGCIEFYPTEVVFSYKCIKESMPLLEIAERLGDDEEMVGIDDEVFGDDFETIDDDDETEGDDLVKPEVEYEAEKVMDCITHSNGSVEYLIKFKGYSDTEWIPAETTVGCKKLIREYEALQALKELGRGMKTIDKNETTRLSAAVELNIKQELQGVNREDAFKAIMREEKQMMSRRLRQLNGSQVDQLTDTQKKEAYRLRHLLTKRRPTIEQEAAGLEGDYKDSWNHYCQDQCSDKVSRLVQASLCIGYDYVSVGIYF